MVSNSAYYKHSGHIGLIGPLIMIVFGFVSAVVLGTVYGYLIWYNPFVYINFLATMIFGGLCGASVSVAAKFAKVRNDKFVIFFCFAVGLFSLYTGWVAWLYALSEQSFFSPTSPDGMFSALSFLAEDGIWTIFSWTPVGSELYGIWVFEAILIVGSALFASSKFVGESANTFCDNCNKWTTDMYTSPLLAEIADPEGLKVKLEQAEYQPLFDLARADATGPPGAYTRLTVQGCQECFDFFCLDVKQVALSADDKGEVKEAETLLVDNLIIGKKPYESIKARVGRI